MSQKSKAQLTTTLISNISDPLNRQNTAVRVRGINQDIIDSSLNSIDGGNITSLSATTLSGGTIYSGSTNLYDIFSGGLPNLEIGFGNGTNNIISSSNFIIGNDRNVLITKVTASGSDKDYAGLQLFEAADDLANIFKYRSTYTGNLAGTSVAYADILFLNNGSKNVVTSGRTVLNIGTNFGTRLDNVGFGIYDTANVHTDNNYLFNAGNLQADATRILSGGTDLYDIFGHNSTFLAPTQIGFGNTLSGLTGSSSLIYSDGTFPLMVIKGQQFIGHITGGQYGLQTTTNLLLYGGPTCISINTDGTVTSNSTEFSSIGGFRANYLTGTTISATTFQSDSMIGTGDRMVEASTGGTLSATKEILAAYISDSTTQNLLEDVSNWDATANYTGTTITNTFQGQKHYNSNYLFEAVDDNTFIRLIRG